MKNKIWLLAIPMYIFTFIFVMCPLIYMIILSFLTKDTSWGITNQFTYENYKKMINPIYVSTLWTSLKIATLTTLFTALIGYPFGYFMSRLKDNIKNIVMLLIIIPFWTNALVRIYGWIIILRDNGLLSNFLLSMGFISEKITILYTQPAVIIGMVYALLPFMILTVYSSCLKLDYSFVEAAKDLGASPIKAFFTVTFKLTLPGLLSGFVLVFIPSIGLFFISDLLGGGKVMLVGNLIKNELTQGRNLPFGAALSVILLAIMILIIQLYKKITKTENIENII